MNTFAEVVEKVNQLSTEELEEIKYLIDKQLSERRIDQIRAALIEARKSSDTFTYYTTGEDVIASLKDVQ